MSFTLTALFGRSGSTLRHGRVLLVEPRRSHYDAWSLLREISRQHLERYEPAWAPDELSRRAWRRRLARYRSDRRLGEGAAFLVLRSSDRSLIGGVTLSNVRRGVTQTGSVGYWIGLPFVRQGYASDALAALLAHAYNDLDLHRIEAACMPSNRASIGVLERAGFRREGLARRCICINGIYEDHLQFARLRDDPPRAVRPASTIAVPAISIAGAAPEVAPDLEPVGALEGRAA